jgi:hypothetical protein
MVPGSGKVSLGALRALPLGGLVFEAVDDRHGVDRDTCQLTDRVGLLVIEWQQVFADVREFAEVPLALKCAGPAPDQTWLDVVKP